MSIKTAKVYRHRLMKIFIHIIFATREANRIFDFPMEKSSYLWYHMEKVVTGQFLQREEHLHMTKLKNTFGRIDSRLERYQFLTGNAVKIIAMLCMLVDHFTKTVLTMIYDSWIINDVITHDEFNQFRQQIFKLERIGMIAFPLFAFLLVEGFCHTHSRKKYALSLIAFAFISELPFDLAFFSELATRRGTFPFFWEYQNVFFTLFLGLCSMWCIERIGLLEGKFRKIPVRCLQVISVIAMCCIAELICSDYGAKGILFITFFYVSRNCRSCQAIFYLLAFMVFENSLHISQLVVCLAIMLYNGKRGKLRINKYAFYAFYPIHILLLYIATLVLPFPTAP